MDLQTRKIHFIQEFLQLKNEKIIEKFENILRIEKQNIYEEPVKPMSIDEFDELIDKAEDDSQNGRLLSSDEMKKEIDSWT
jgi:di/tripeptidase